MHLEFSGCLHLSFQSFTRPLPSYWQVRFLQVPLLSRFQTARRLSRPLGQMLRCRGKKTRPAFSRRSPPNFRSPESLRVFSVNRLQLFSLRRLVLLPSPFVRDETIIGGVFVDLLLLFYLSLKDIVKRSSFHPFSISSHPVPVIDNLHSLDSRLL